MSCYEPFKVKIIESDYIQKNRFNKKYVRFLGKFDYDLDSLGLKNKEFTLLPCGKCLGCRLDYARRWSDRLILEYAHMKKGVFVTLTYENSFLPGEVDPDTGEVFDHVVRVNEASAPVAPLRKYDVSQFLKRLRSRLNYKKEVKRFKSYWPELINNPQGKPDVLIKFFAAGEYGDRRGRPHYHIILFGISLDDLNFLSPLIPHDKNELGQETFRSPFLEDIWEKGIVGVSEANYLTMGYTARYTVKKALGNSYPAKYDLPDEFTLMSRNPGIGASFLTDHPGIVDEVSCWYDHGKAIYWPKYLLQKAHEVKTNIHVLCPDGYLDIIPFVTYDGTYIDRQIKRSELALDKVVNTFEYDERPYDQVVKVMLDNKRNSIKKLQRGDVDMNV